MLYTFWGTPKKGEKKIKLIFIFAKSSEMNGARKSWDPFPNMKKNIVVRELFMNS